MDTKTAAPDVAEGDVVVDFGFDDDAELARAVARIGANGAYYTTPEEGRALFEFEARKLMGMRGEEFIRRWEAGEYAEIADKAGHRHIIYLSLLIPFARQSS